ncbi:GNAT family N-acetyltransferase [Hymenobacter sp. ASUV-10]|uniref:GNAT family N-acetyltransferase n=1 Tax=Hymenobacter aranciens TaxID=3063996 RepID=A0ABT9B7C4_9BACT|nr:GNAT family N-acetyltransferase [Hymenobacter sp. ASUV-10]MDO7874171.1 GNAT family N-acetyltransferase [Hymenobacter sp. ASUV-10]
MMLPTIQPLGWDSDFLGFSVGRLLTDGLSEAQIATAVADARRAGFRLLYAVASPANAAAATALRQAGALLADRKVTFAMPVLTGPAPVAAAISATTAYSPQLESLAWQSGEYSRFRLDPRLAPTVFREMYSRWLHNSLTGSIARQVLVWRAPTGHELGLLTLGEKNGRADIGLLAVDAAARGQRVGQQLVAAAVAQAAAWGYAELQVVTQGDNEPACRFYEKCGFQLVQEEHIYHCWLD